MFGVLGRESRIAGYGACASAHSTHPTPHLPTAPGCKSELVTLVFSDSGPLNIFVERASGGREAAERTDLLDGILDVASYTNHPRGSCMRADGWYNWQRPI